MAAAASLPSTNETEAFDAPGVSKLPVKDAIIKATRRLDFGLADIFQAYPLVVIV
jgi:hypothetical protein